MKLKIKDYENKETPVNIKDFENVVKIVVQVITGDEIMFIVYKNYDIEIHDSSDCRLRDYYDGEYSIYDITKNINYIDKWKKRKSSYDDSWR